ncbi:MAG: peptidylprolyl isomerase, partial [Calditrichia bacterium]|nr:peptidylprolyl isomerase [Calditrichia bacterium]
MRQSESSLDDAMLKRSHEQTWNGMIEQVVLNKYIKEYNITVSPDEIQYYILNVPVQQLKQHPQLQTNGQFDIEKYQMAVKNDKDLFMNLYYNYQQNLPFMKLQEIVSEGTVVTEAEILEDYLRKNIYASAEYLYIPISSFYKKVKEVSDSEAKAYYNSHPNEFKQEAQRVLNYVEFPVVTSKNDSEKVMADAASIIRQLNDGEKFEEIAPIYSDDQSVERNNGDLGYSSLDDYVKEFREAAENAKIGDIVGPVKTQLGMHVLTVLKRNKEKDDKGKLITKAHVKHILLMYEPSTDTRDFIYNNAQRLSDNTGKNGLAAAAEALNYVVKETAPFSQGGFIPGIGNAKQAVDFAFNEKVGSVSNIIYVKDRNNSEKYYIVSVREKIKEGIKGFEEVKNVCISKVKIEKREKLAVEHANSLQNA